MGYKCTHMCSFGRPSKLPAPSSAHYDAIKAGKHGLALEKEKACSYEVYLIMKSKPTLNVLSLHQLLTSQATHFWWIDGLIFSQC